MSDLASIKKTKSLIDQFKEVPGDRHREGVQRKMLALCQSDEDRLTLLKFVSKSCAVPMHLVILGIKGVDRRQALLCAVESLEAYKRTQGLTQDDVVPALASASSSATTPA